MFTIKGVLALQIHRDFLEGLRQAIIDEKFISRTYRSLAGPEIQDNQRFFLLLLAQQAEQRAQGYEAWLHRMGGLVPTRITWPLKDPQDRMMHSWIGPTGMAGLLRLEQQDLRRLTQLCQVERVWVS